MKVLHRSSSPRARTKTKNEVPSQVSGVLSSHRKRLSSAKTFFCFFFFFDKWKRIAFAYLCSKTPSVRGWILALFARGTRRIADRACFYDSYLFIYCHEPNAPKRGGGAGGIRSHGISRKNINVPAKHLDKPSNRHWDSVYDPNWIPESLLPGPDRRYEDYVLVRSNFVYRLPAGF